MSVVFCDGWVVYPVRTFNSVGPNGRETRVEFHAFSEDNYNPRMTFSTAPNICFSLPEFVMREPSPRYSILATLYKQREYRMWDRKRRRPADLAEVGA